MKKNRQTLSSPSEIDLILRVIQAPGGSLMYQVNKQIADKLAGKKEVQRSVEDALRQQGYRSNR